MILIRFFTSFLHFGWIICPHSRTFHESFCLFIAFCSSSNSVFILIYHILRILSVFLKNFYFLNMWKHWWTFLMKWPILHYTIWIYVLFLAVFRCVWKLSFKFLLSSSFVLHPFCLSAHFVCRCSLNFVSSLALLHSFVLGFFEFIALLTTCTRWGVPIFHRFVPQSYFSMPSIVINKPSMMFLLRCIHLFGTPLCDRDCTYEFFSSM